MPVWAKVLLGLMAAVVLGVAAMLGAGWYVVQRLRSERPAAVASSASAAVVAGPPEWLTYPGATVESSVSSSSSGTTQLSLRAEAAAEEVAAYYASQLRANQFEVSSVSLTGTTAVTSKDGARHVSLQMLGSREGHMRFVLVYHEKADHEKAYREK